MTGGAGAAEVKAAINRNPVAVNESLELVFSASVDPDGEPDFSVLRQQFDIVDQQRSSHSSWINGKTEHRQEWHLTLIPKHAGEVLIPPIAFGHDSSQPLKVKVIEPPVIAGQQDELFLEVEAAPQRLYQQAQLLYTVRFYRRLQMTQARLAEPELADTVIEQLGDDVSYSTHLNGLEYAVTERKYAIFPQQPGWLEIPALTVDAEVLRYQGGQRNFWGRSVTETRRVISKALRVEVLPLPDGMAASWLPAEDVHLSEQWSEPQLQINVGEPLTRTVTLSVKGSTVAQLPELLPSVAPDGFKQYPDQPQLHEEKHPDGLWASREEKVAFIASKAGEYMLPAIEIPWFDTRSGQSRRVQLPAVKVRVQAADAGNQAPVVSPAAVAPVTGEKVEIEQAHTGFWPLLALGLAIGWALTTLILLKRRPAFNAEPPAVLAPVVSVKRSQLRSDLQQACLLHRPDLARTALLAYFAVDSLAQLAERYPALSTAITSLNRVLYGQTAESWQGDSLWQALVELEQTPVPASVAATREILEPLFKIK